MHPLYLERSEAFKENMFRSIVELIKDMEPLIEKSWLSSDSQIDLSRDEEKLTMTVKAWGNYLIDLYDDLTFKCTSILLLTLLYSTSLVLEPPLMKKMH
jgi:hypothetical protein